jgi:hypothetical protein
MLRRPPSDVALAGSANHRMPVLRAAQQVLAEVLEEPACVGEPGTRRGIRAEYLGAVQGRLGEYGVRRGAGNRCPVPHVVIDNVPFAPAVPFPPDELLVFQDADRLQEIYGRALLINARRRCALLAGRRALIWRRVRLIADLPGQPGRGKLVL